jgi:hypothetical protein
MKRTKTDHTKIEDGIMDVWGVKDLVDTLIWRYIDHPKPMTEDQMWNHLEAISCVLDLECEKLMDTYCQVYELNEYASDEVKAYRASLFADPEVKAAMKAVKKTKKAK